MRFYYVCDDTLSGSVWRLIVQTL